jgi:hypothetical protein
VFRVSVDKRLGDLVGLLLGMIQEVGYPLIGASEENEKGGKQGGVGSYANRAIKEQGPDTKPSIHSSALALDLWSRSNPQRWGDRVAFSSTMHPLAVRLFAAADFYWGGWFWDISNATYLDAMHIEYNLKPGDVAASTARLKAEYKAITGETEPGNPPTPPDPGGDVTPEQIKVLQTQLNKVGTSPPLVVDGTYGPKTETAVIGLSALVEGQIDLAETSTKEDTKADAIEAVSGI